MRAKILRLSLAATAALAAAVALVAPAAAHHSPARFDSDQVVTIEGVVTEYEWANPHVYIYVAQTTDAGATVDWEIEGLPPAILRRQGWSQDTLRVGDRVAVTGNPARNSKGLFLTGLARDGNTLYDRQAGFAQLASAGTATEGARNGLDGTWATVLSIDVMAKFFPQSLQPTEKGAAALALFNADEGKVHPGLDCSPMTAPTTMIIPDVKRITTENGVLRIAGEFDGAERTIHLDAATHAGAERSLQGHSIGRWEGETLVIETTQFADHALGIGFGLPSGAEKRLVERLTPNAARTALTYHFESSDPEFLATPMTGEVQWAYRSDLEFAPEQCDPENARRFIDD
jgi:hypothetical protein